MSPLDSCPNCEAPSLKKGKIPLYVGGYYIGDFDGYWCPVCREEFLDPATVDEAEDAVTSHGLFGIVSRHAGICEPTLALRFSETSANAILEPSDASIVRVQHILCNVSRTEREDATEQISSISNIMTG
jgi:hypothetical protein